MKPKNKGKYYEDLFRTDLESEFKKQIFIHRFQDTGDATAKARGRSKHAARKKEVVYVDSQPSDFLVTLNGVTAYVEVKDCNNKTSFPFGNITHSQMIAAKRQVAAKGRYYFVIHHIGVWFCVPAEVILGVTDRKSIRWVDLQDYRIEGPIDIKRYFDGITRN